MYSFKTVNSIEIAFPKHKDPIKNKKTKSNKTEYLWMHL